MVGAISEDAATWTAIDLKHTFPAFQKSVTERSELMFLEANI